jgi:hypothetical protein
MREGQIYSLIVAEETAISIDTFQLFRKQAKRRLCMSDSFAKMMTVVRYGWTFSIKAQVEGENR